jgi:hypothetical protein
VEILHERLNGVGLLGGDSDVLLRGHRGREEASYREDERISKF